MRYRITVRGTDIELRGYVDGATRLREFGSALVDGMENPVDPMILASPAENDWDPFKSDQFLEEAGERLPRLIGESAISLALVTENSPDPKFCVELGYMIALDKPIIVLVRDGAKVPEKLRLVADEIVEWKGELSESGLTEAMGRVAAKLTK